MYPKVSNSCKISWQNTHVLVVRGILVYVSLGLMHGFVTPAIKTLFDFKIASLQVIVHGENFFSLKPSLVEPVFAFLQGPFFYRSLEFDTIDGSRLAQVHLESAPTQEKTQSRWEFLRQSDSLSLC